MIDVATETLSTCILCSSEKLRPACEQNGFCKCQDCGLIFDNPRPKWSEILRFYSKETQYDDWLKELPERDALWKRRLKRVLRFCRQGRLLDVGTGIGQFLHFAKEHFIVEGSEVSTSAIEIAKVRYGLTLKQGTVESLDFKEAFDAITMFHVLEHVPSPKVTLEACYQKLRKGGFLFIAVPNDIASFLTRRNRWRESQGAKKYLHLGKVGLPKLSLSMSEIHLSHFTPEVLSTALSELGFEVVESSLDPAFAASGFRKLRRYRRYYFYDLVRRVTGKNLYDTIWMTARRN